MNICLIMAGGFVLGGLEKHTIELAKNLKYRGFNVSVIAHQDFKSYFLDVNFIPLNLTKSRNNFISLYKLFKILKDSNFDIVHTQANKSTAMVVKVRKFLKNIKLVSTLHNSKSNTKAFESSDFVITVSDKISENLKNINRQTIYNGISFDKKLDLYEDLYRKFYIDKNKFIVCSVARFTKVKRFELLIKAMEKLDVHLILVGDGSESNNLKKLSKELDIESKVTFTGAIQNDDVKKIVYNSSLFVMTSDNEGFPYTFIETMFCKTPFISTPISDIPKILDNKYIIKFDNVSDIIQKINYIKNNYENVLIDFENIFDLAENKFTVNNMVDETIEIYKKVIDGHYHIKKNRYR